MRRLLVKRDTKRNLVIVELLPSEAVDFGLAIQDQWPLPDLGYHDGKAIFEEGDRILHPEEYEEVDEWD